MAITYLGPVPATDMRPWIGVDLDGTLVHDDCRRIPGKLGAPIPAMVERVKRWLAEGQRIKIFTARVADVRPEERKPNKDAIRLFCLATFGEYLEVTCIKDQLCQAIWDDRCTQVVTNTGEIYHSMPDIWAANMICADEIIPKKVSVPELLQEMAETFAERSETYREGHFAHGKILRALFPSGIHLPSDTEAAKFVLLNFVIGKIVRYGVCLDQGDGGHVDSAHDAAVFSTILEAVTRNE